MGDHRDECVRREVSDQLRVSGPPGKVRAHRIDVRPVHPLELGGRAAPGGFLAAGRAAGRVPAVFSVT